MKRMFDADLQDATPIDRASWEAHGVVDKLEERMARLLRYWLRARATRIAARSTIHTSRGRFPLIPGYRHARAPCNALDPPAEIDAMLGSIVRAPRLLGRTWMSALLGRTCLFSHRLRGPEARPPEASASAMDRLEALASCAWIRNRESLLIQGPPGAGKTHLALGIAMRAIGNGFSVAFHRLEDLLAALERDAGVSPELLNQRKHLNAALLVVDEVGCAPMTRDEASLFLELVSYRDGRGSMLIATSKGIAKCPAALAGDDVLATAILDRLLVRSHVLDISGIGYRLHDLERTAVSSSAAY